MKRKIKRAVSVILIMTLLLSLFPVRAVWADETDEPYPYTIFAGSDENGAVSLNAGNICVNGNICTNGTIATENPMNVNGDRIENAGVSMPNLWVWINENYSSEEYDIEDGDIILDGDVRLNSDDVVATKRGNITVESTNADLNGLIYAPKGTIFITAQNLNMNSVILIAERIVIQCPSINANYNRTMAEGMVWTDYLAEYKVSFNIGDVETDGIPDQYIEAEGYAVEPEDPECDGYIFLGWYHDPDYNEWFEFDETPITKETILYGRWYHNSDKTDTDGDTLSDEYEKLLGTDPELYDTDGDGLSDYVEAYYDLGTDPCIADTDGNGISDGDEDADGDGLSNAREVTVGTEPDVMDTDGDELNDGEEVDIYNTDPLVADTDSDTLGDGKEVLYGTDPLQFNDLFNILAKVEKGDTDEADISISVGISNISGEQAESLSVEPVLNDSLFPSTIPGYLGCAYDLNMSGTFKEAEITFEFDDTQSDTEGFDPVIYYFDETEQNLVPLETVVTGNKAKAVTTHFSTYILMNRRVYEDSMEWRDTWEVNKYTDAEIILITDDSGSMLSNDPSNIRLSVACSLINNMPENCKANVVKFSSTYSRLGTMTDDREAIKKYLTTAYFKSSGLTVMNSAVMASFDYYSEEISDTTLKMMVLLSDGIATDSDRSVAILKKAEELGVKIYCVGLGSSQGYFDSHLRPLAVQTGGEFYHADNASELKKIYADITDKIDLSEDSDRDGIPDYYEDNLPCFNGLKLELDKNNPDTDGDGVSDGDELEKLQFVYNQDHTKVWVYGKMKSNPTKKDSDGDGLWDHSPIYGNGGKIAPRDPEPLRYNGKPYMWKKHISQMQYGKIGTHYAYDESQVALNDILNDIDDKGLIKSIKGAFDDWSRSLVIENQVELDDALNKNKEKIRELLMQIKVRCTGEKAAAVGAAFLNFAYDNLKVAYHSKPETWQKLYGYNMLYDDVFRVASKMDMEQVKFFDGGSEYKLWLWKGDYWNLGTGAEIGLYKQSAESDDHYDAAQFELPMQLSLYDNMSGTMHNCFNWHPNVRQWWITGFDWRKTNPRPDKLVSVGRIDFSNRRSMGEAISAQVEQEKKEKQYLFSDLIFDEDGYLWIIWE